MQKIIVRKLKLQSSSNSRNYMAGKTGPSEECAVFENIIPQEIDEGWKITNVNVSYDKVWACHVVFFVLEKEDEKG